MHVFLVQFSKTSHIFRFLLKFCFSLYVMCPLALTFFPLSSVFLCHLCIFFHTTPHVLPHVAAGPTKVTARGRGFGVMLNGPNPPPKNVAWGMIMLTNKGRNLMNEAKNRGVLVARFDTQMKSFLSFLLLFQYVTFS